MATRPAPPGIPAPDLTPHRDAAPLDAPLDAPVADGAPAPRCANCGTPAGDAFCPHCGQEQHDLHRSVRSLFAEVLDSLAGWDGKIPTTLWLLVRHPGRLTTEFLAGRRARYLRPLRLYLTLSLVYFVALSLDWSPSGRSLNLQMSGPADSAAVRDSIAEALSDSIGNAQADSLLDARVARARARRASGAEDTTTVTSHLKREFERRAERLRAMPKEERNRAFTSAFFGQLPNMVFALVPLFALLLRLAYRRAPLFYAEHLVHALHLHAFAMLALTAVHFTPGGWSTIPFLALPAYVWLALRRVYGGSRLRTTAKLTLVLGGYTVALITAVSLMAAGIILFMVA